MSTSDPSALHGKLKEVFGFDDFRYNQKNIVQTVLDGQDTLALMPTGGGKSLCYQLPGLLMDGVTLVISPLISLMQDQVHSLQQHKIPAYFWNSTLTPSQRQDLEEQLLKGEVKFLYLAPEGALSPSTTNLLKKSNVSVIAIDEAHCVSQWGHEFRKDYMRLNELKKAFPGVPTLALTATADQRTRKDICEQLELNSPKTFVSSFDRPNIKYTILERTNEIRQLNEFLKKEHLGETGIVYCLSRKKVEKVASELQDMGYNAIPYHAGLSSDIRTKHQQRFNTEEGVIVVATIAFGMGIDRPDVRFVAHLDLPKSIEGYYQETGRAGRDGEPASAWMVYGFSDVVKLSQMLENTEAGEAYKKVARHKLDAMLSLCETSQCRRQVLLNYFDEETSDHCGNCDTCLTPPETWDATTEAQKFLSTVYRTGQKFGIGYVVDVLRGSQSTKILNNEHDQLSVHGIGQKLSKNEWSGLARQLLNQGYLRVKDWEYKNLALTEKSRPLLKNQEKVELRKLRADSGFKKKSNKQDLARTDSRTIQSHGRQELFESLRELRKNLAQEHAVPPFMVFSDKTLHDICTLLPTSESDFLMVHGVGQSKLEKFGADFLKLVQKHT